MKLTIRHWAFNEGRNGYVNGCCISANPYYADNNPHLANDEYAQQWKAGWKHENERAEKLKDALL